MEYPWQYDETIQVGTDYRDAKEVAAYDERMQRMRNMDAEIRHISKAIGISSDSTIWEIGTGTGQCAIALAATVKRVYATDVSAAMLEYARSKADQRGINNVTFEIGGFLSGFQPADPVDGIVTQLAMHHLPDFWKSQALARIVQKLRPGGRLYLRDVVFPSAIEDHDTFFEKMIAGIRSQADDDTAEKTIRHIKAEFSTLDWILEEMIARAGMRIIEKDCPGFLSTYVCEK